MGEVYNLKRYNLKSGQNRYIEFEQDASALILGVAGGKRYITFQEDVAGTIFGSSDIHILIPFADEPLAEVSCTVQHHTGLLTEGTAKANIKAKIDAAKDMNFEGRADAAIMGEAHLGKIEPIEQQASGISGGEAHIGKYIPFEQDAGAFVNCIVSGGITSIATFLVNATIPPGGEIRVDSDTFSAMMSMDNIIHLYNGDWIHIVRNTDKLQIGAGSGGELTGEIIYDERFV